jgi:protease-4
LSIKSAGDAAVEAEPGYRAIKSFTKKKDKPVIAVINKVGASAAYTIAIHADKVFAAK